MTSEHTSIWNPANIVTMIRICFIPVFVAAMLLQVNPWVSAVIFAILSLTDMLDGYLARSRNEITNFGKFLDPIADKLLVTAAMLCLIQVGSLSSWVALIIIAREFMVSALRMIAATSGEVIAASWIGKWKTAITMITLVMYILAPLEVLGAYSGAFWTITQILMGIAVVLTIWSMIDYFKKSWHFINEGE